MEDVTSKPINNGANINPFRAIWTRPGQAVRAAVAFHGDNMVHRMSMLMGISLILAVNLDRWMRYGAHPVELMLMFLLIGPVMGIIGTYILSAVIRATGGWFKGIAPKNEMMVAMAWSHLPMAAAIFLYAIISAILYKLSPPVWNAGWSGYAIGSILTGIIMAVYFSYIRIKAIAEIHVIPFWQAAVSYVVSITLILAPVIFFFVVYLILFVRSLAAPSLH